MTEESLPDLRTFTIHFSKYMAMGEGYHTSVRAMYWEESSDFRWINFIGRDEEAIAIVKSDDIIAIVEKGYHA